MYAEFLEWLKSSGVEGGASLSLVQKIKNVKNELKQKFNHRLSSVTEKIKVKEKTLFEVEALRENNSDNEDLWKEFLALNYQ